MQKSNDWTPTAINSWTRDIAVSQERTTFLAKVFKIPFAICFDGWMKVFQYKVIHRILPTNKKLCQYGIKTLCYYCDLEEESLLHHFCECDIAVCIWEELIDWYNLFGYDFTYLGDSQSLIGYSLLQKWQFSKSKVKK